MKLLYIANQRLPTEKAYGIQITKMCEAFADAGLEVELIAPSRKNSIKQPPFDYYGARRNFKFTVLPAPDFYLFGKLDAVATFIKSFISSLILCRHALRCDADIIYSRDELPLFMISFFIKAAKLIFEAHRFSNWRKFWYRRFRGTGVKVAVISGRLQEEFVKLGFKSKNILCVPDAVDLGEFNVDQTKENARRQLGLPSGKIAMYTGHLFDWKGAHVLAETATYLPEIWFVFVGGTEIDISKFKEKFGNEKNIKILGQRPHREIPVFLKAADVLVLPNSAVQPISQLYTSPLKLFEYMAAGRPIVASDLPSIREILDDDNTVFAEADNPESFALSIRKVLSNPLLAKKISEKAFSDVQNYTWQKRAEKILRFTD